MSYIALYRKFRPKTFDEIKGQDQVTKVLKNQIRSGRIGHAYIFFGTRGTGKTSAAKILAKAVNCENPVDGNPCLVCESCKRIEEGRNLNVVEVDGASTSGVDTVREIIEEVRYSPTEGKYKVYIIDEVHMLTQGAFNALLKTLEEPPSYIIFILATTESHKIPMTILSRCQRYDFKRITAGTIGDRIKELLDKEGETYEEEAVDFIARKGDGSMRDALSLLDQCLAFYFGERLTYENVLQILGAMDVTAFLKLFSAIRKGDAAACLDVVEEISAAGLDFLQFVGDFSWFLRNLLLLLVSKEAEKRIDVSREKIKLMKEAVEGVREEEITHLILLMSKLALQMKQSVIKRTELEIALIKAVKPEAERSEEALLARIAKLERRMEEGNFVLGKAEGLGASVTDASKIEVAKEEKKEEKSLERKALPEEIKKIAKEFGAIISKPNIKQPLRSYLKNVQPVYEEGSGSLVLGAEDETTRDWVEKAENLEVIRKNIEAVIGGSVSLKVKLLETAKKEGATEILGLENIAAELISFED